jgi:hypothetical protein
VSGRPYREAAPAEHVPEACPGCGVMMSWGYCGRCQMDRLVDVAKAAQAVAGSGPLEGHHWCVPVELIHSPRAALARLRP